MDTQKDFGSLLIAAVLLLFTVGYLTQCARTPPRVEPEGMVTAATPTGASRKPERDVEREGKGRSAHELIHEQQQEEQGKREMVVHALQTIAANPELRRTYGFNE